MNPIRIALVLVCALWIGSSVGAEVLSPAPPRPQKIRAPAARSPIEFTLPDLHGSPLSLKSLRGHPLILDFWATWCPPCRKQIPELKAVYEHYRAAGLIVIGIACDAIEGDGLRDVRPFVKKFDITYPILIGTAAVTDQLGVEGMPTTMFLDREGRLVSTLVGGGRSGEISKAAKTLLVR
jgi:cytochrome c biogenesis protein CcmG/thiol:disulfide interchange protein DsbE